MFTNEQKNVINSRDGYYFVSATAGAGKTASLTERIATLISSGISSNSILAITFTTKAAKEISDRVKNRVGEHQSTICTFHSLAYRVFKKYHVQMGYNHIELVNKKFILTKCVQLTKWSVKDIQTFLTDFETLKKSYLTDDIFEGDTKKLFHRIEKELQTEGKITYDDLIYQSCKFLESNEKERKEFGSQFKYIIIDEAQDTNKAQFKLIELLDIYNNVMIIADPVQSIMGFQGSSVDNIFDFDTKFHPTILHLSTNFRSTKAIVDVSNKVLEFSLYDKRFKKPSLSANEQGTKPDFKMYTSYNEQAEKITKQIKRYTDLGYKYDDIAILYRNNNLSAEFEKYCIIEKIPYQVKSGSFINRLEIQILLSCLKLGTPSYAKENMNCVATISSCFNNQISDGILYTVFTSDKQKRTFQEIVRSSDKIAGVGKVRKDSLNALADFIDGAIATIPRRQKLYKVNSLDDLCKYVSSLVDMITDDSNEKQYRCEGIAMFNEIWNEIFKDKDANYTLKNFINDFSILYGESDELNKEKDKVILSTIHSFKGLEAKIVFLVTIKDGIFPRSVENVNEDQYMDDICLWYVGLSRAKKILHISSVEENRSWAYKQNTYSLLQMFLKSNLIEGLDNQENRKYFERDTTFYDVYYNPV